MRLWSPISTSISDWNSKPTKCTCLEVYGMPVGCSGNSRRMMYRVSSSNFPVAWPSGEYSSSTLLSTVWIRSCQVDQEPRMIGGPRKRFDPPLFHLSASTHQTDVFPEPLSLTRYCITWRKIMHYMCIDDLPHFNTLSHRGFILNTVFCKTRRIANCRNQLSTLIRYSIYDGTCWFLSMR